MKIKNIVAIVEETYPISSALEDDQEKIGYEVVFDKELEINKVIVTLDITPKVLEYAIDNKIKLIITHHPLFYNGLELEVKVNQQKNEMLSLITRNQITIYAAHTNVDVGEKGLSYKIIQKLGLKPSWFLDKTTKLGAIVHFDQPMLFGDIVQLFIKKIGLSYIRYIRSKEKKYKKMAFVAGAGGSFVNEVINENTELFITSDLPWHAIIHLQSAFIDVIEVSHSVENEFRVVIADLLKNYHIDVIQVMVPDFTKVYAE